MVISVIKQLYSINAVSFRWKYWVQSLPGILQWAKKRPEAKTTESGISYNKNRFITIHNRYGWRNSHRLNVQPRYYRGFSIYRQRNVSTGLTGRTLATQPGKRTLSATHDIQNLSSIWNCDKIGPIAVLKNHTTGYKMTSLQQRAELHRQIWAIANDVRGSVDG